MKKIKEHSYGLIPFLKEKGSTKVLLINMYGSAGGTHWTFPKGRPEKGETPLETAVRETKEEVGLSIDSVDDSKEFTLYYEFMYEGAKIEKHVTFFLCTVRTPAITIKEDEVKEASWYTIPRARRRLTHDVARALLDEVVSYIEKQK